MTGPELIFGALALVGTGLSVASAAGAFTPDPPSPPTLEDKDVQASRRAAIERAQRAFGVSRTRVANDDVVGLSLAQGKKITGPVAGGAP